MSFFAHELRTPITNLLTQTDVVLTQQRTNEAYRDILSSNAEELQRLARTISDMLFLAQTENGITLPSYERLSLQEEISETSRAMGPAHGAPPTSSGAQQ